MIKVVVAEDKHPILRNLVRKIENYSPQLQVIGEATDGLSALDMCLRLKPHILFTDIRMPGMDGLELIRQVKQTLPDTLFAIISGYDDFGYAREALRHGVKEFLLKPVTQQAMDEVLGNVMQLSLSANGAKEQQFIYDRLRGRQVTSGTSTDEADHAAYYVLNICVGAISKFHLDLVNPYHDVWFKFDMPRFLMELTDMPYDDAWVYEGEAMNEQIVVFRCNQEHTFPIQAIYQAFHEAFSHHQLFFTFALSNQVDNLANLKLEYQLTRMILGNNAVFGASKLIQVKDYTFNAPSTVDPDKAFDKQKLLTFIKINNKDAFLQEITLILSKWQALSYLQIHVELCLTHLLQCACQAYFHQTIISHEIKLELDEVISISKDYTSLAKNVSFLFERFFYNPQGQESAGHSIKTAIDVVDQYFQVHLANEITIADIADMVNFNVSFLSREFKKVKGISPIEYLTQLRIEKAKQLIIEPANHKFKDIGTMVGYSNPYYFSKVFKLMTGLTPSEFKHSASIEPSS